MICDTCGNKIEDDAIYCSYCGMKVGEKIEVKQQNNLEDIPSSIVKATGLLIILIGIIGIADTISFRIIWNSYTSWYQFIYIFLYILGVVYGYKLTKREGWGVSFVLILIYIIHYSVIFIQKNINPINPPITPIYIMSVLDLIVLILLVTKKSEYNIEYKMSGSQETI